MASPGSDVLPQLLVLVGPTACGKTALALELAERCPLEVVSADSRTVYRGMDIGTAKPTLAERQRVPHHLLDVVDPDEPYSLATYQTQALAAIADIQARGRLAVLVGGAGLYVSAVCDGLQLPDVPPDLAFRTALEAREARVLQAELAQVDPESARRIEPRNVRRMIRALEVHHATGVPFSAWQSRRFALPFTPVFLGLEVERQELYRRIDARIDAWVAGGLVDEVRGLLAAGYAASLPSMSSLGYREIARYVHGELALAEAVVLFKQATHQYAKRQLTWFRRDLRVHWLNNNDDPYVPEIVFSLLNKTQF
jgi:tRNA dimethylallyltransferase